MSNKTVSILSIEDDLSIRRFLKTYLTQQGFVLHQAENGVDALKIMEAELPDLILLDLGLPDIDGLEVIKKIRSWSQVPIIVISAVNEEAKKVAALDLEADDYLTKPFGVEELMARIRVALRHKQTTDAENPVFFLGDLIIDRATQQAFLRGQDLNLSNKEYAILVLLAKYVDKVVTSERLLREVWGDDAEKEYLRIYIHQLRRKLEIDPAQPEYLHTRTGIGYQLSFISKI
ncbi:MAG: response regulator transcription factor [Gammaproteobacteria bacterium]|nr:response regulator transcription factor [Gammaproteobacteria bacterium]